MDISLSRIGNSFVENAQHKSTKNQYSRVVNAYLTFLASYGITKEEALPLKAVHVRNWLASISRDKSLKWDSYTKKIAALRDWSRCNGYYDLDHLLFDIIRKVKHEFCKFMQGLKQSLDRTPKKKRNLWTSNCCFLCYPSF